MADKLRGAAQAIVDRWDSPAWGGSAENLRHTGEYIAELRAALAQQDAQVAPQGPEFTDAARAALLWVLWHHQGGSSPVGQPIRFALGMGAHAHLSEQHIAEAKRWAAQTGSTTAEFHAPTPPAQQDAKAVPTQRQYELALGQWDQWKSYALELQAKLVKYEGGSPMVLNAAPTPPAQRLMLTASELLNMTPESIPAEHDGALLEYARAVIEAYERKNGLRI